MPLVDMFRRASTYILGNDNGRINDKLINNFTKQYDDNEVLYCKNNVCVHPPLMIRNNIDVIHHPGYLTITTKIFVDQYNNSKRPTLFLTWIPNTALTKYTTTTTSMESLNSIDSSSTTTTTTNPFLMNNDLNNDSISSLSLSSSLTTDSCYLNNEKNTININISSPDVEILTTPDLDQKHNSTTFIDSTNSSPILSTKQQQQHKCHRFSVDLSQMRSLRLFFNDDNCTCGQLVIASRESQYKILHFHYGGLDHLAQVLHQWHSLLHNIKTINNSDDDGDVETLPFRHFMVVCRPEVSDLELHPEEGQVPKLTSELFYSLFNVYGQLDDDLTLRKTIFFNGMDRDLRKHVWPFLLHLYPYQSTYNERQQIDQLHRLEYDEITRRRLELNGKQLQQFKRHTQSVIEKDVIRTDRCNPYFMGDDDNPNLIKMKNILLNYSIYNPQLGYTQGMSDLLAPILCELNDEIMAFWCFVGLMQQRGVFIATPTDHDMDCNLKYLKELIHLLLPNFYQHLEKYKDDTASELLFVHRWILLCFKREFTEAVALRIWEACWSNYLTDYFHLFICLSIISVYVDDVIRQDLCADEMLLYFSSLAMYMDGQLIIRKARGLLHQFRQLREIPCTLSDLCRKCGPGIWDSTHSPRIYCIGSGGHENNGCCNHF